MKRFFYFVVLFMSLYINSFSQTAPTISYPTSSFTVYENPVSLIWWVNGSIIGYTYNVQVAVDPSYNNLVLNVDNLTSQSYNFTMSPGVHYYWRVRSKVGGVYSSWTNESFTSAGTPQTYSITASASAHGSISPSGVVSANVYDSKRFFFTPDSAYQTDSIVVDGVTRTDSLVSFTFSLITGNHSIGVYFSKQKYSITASVSGNGTVTPAGVSHPEIGDSLVYTITPDSGYHITDVLVDGVSQGVITTYTFHNIQANHTISGVFAINTYTITATAFSGTITPSGVIPANFGDNKTFYFTTDSLNHLIRVIVDNTDTLTGISSYTFTNINANHTIAAYYHQPYTVYVSLSGDDLNMGTINSPLRTISNAISRPFVEQIFVADGIYDFGSDATGIGIPRSTLYIQGSASTIVKGFFLSGARDVTVKNFSIMNPSNPSSIMLFTFLNNIRFDNISIYGGTTGIETNTTFIGSDSIYFSNITIRNVTNSGIFMQTGKGITFDNVYITSSIPSLSTAVIILDGRNIVFSNSHFEKYQFGVMIQRGDNINIHDCTFNDLMNGIYSFTGGGEIINNLSITGNTLFRMCQTGVSIQKTTLGSNCTNFTMNGKIKFRQVNLSVLLDGYIIAPYFNGVSIDSSASSPIVFLGNTQGAVIHNSIFKTGMAIVNQSPFDVDARNNDFPLAASYWNILSFIMDKNTNPMYGLVDYSGSTWGLFPSITVESKTNTYKGASYYLNVDLDKKETDYNFISGKFTYDTAKVEYLSYLSNGLVNDAGWYFNVTSTPGVINFAGFGITPISTDGTLFKLYLKVKNTAPDSVALISGTALDFTGNSTPGEFTINNGTILYHAPVGVLQDAGDVTLDGYVNMSDFYALLYHLSGVTLLTDPQALLNADFDGNSVINVDDLNALYAFVNGGPVAMPLGSGTIAVNGGEYNGQQSVKIPVTLMNGKNVRSLDVTLTYDQSLIGFQSYAPSAVIPGFELIAFESSPGKTKFIFNSVTSIQNNFAAGELMLRFKNGVIPVGAVISTFYTINGKNPKQGPSVKLNSGGVLTSVEENTGIIPEKFSLYQNYPNPFNPTTNIRFDLTENSQVTLKIYDVLGNEVRTLVNENKAPGAYSIEWNGKDNNGVKTASGIYIYRINAGSNSFVRKMVMLK